MKTPSLVSSPTSESRFPASAAAGLGLALLLAAVVWEFYRSLPPSQLAAIFTDAGQWLIVIELVAFLAVMLAGLLVGLAQIPPFAGSAWVEKAAARLVTWRSRIGQWGWVIALVIALFPAILLLQTYWGSVFTGPSLRLGLLLATASLAAVCIPLNRERLLEAQALAGAMILVASLFAIAVQLSSISNYPFSISWSEGNRIWEYSLYFGRARYANPADLAPTSDAVGRHLLWGLPFLIPNTPIWFHRLWNAILATLPHICLGLALASWTNLPRLGKLGLGLWFFLFLAQGPIYTPLILSALVVVLFTRRGKWPLALITAAVAAYYASLSRWTWLPAAPSWAAMIWLAQYRLPDVGKPGAYWIQLLQRLIPAALLGLAGLAGGLLANPTLFQPEKLTGSTSLSQPLLWYRLLPNATYPEGILAALLMAGGAPTILLMWSAVTGRWRLNWVQAAAYAGVSLLFLAAGLVISVKAGGGNNLHNLDLFLVTLAILTGLALRGWELPESQAWPAAARLLLFMAVLFPAWSTLRSGSPIELLPQEKVNAALDAIRTQVALAQQQGEVLFLDQRQLLTFGQITGVPVVEEYEKKYVMDAAMAGDQAFFDPFYRDLATRRFALIVSEALFTREKEGQFAFSEENNAWVNWVSEPLLCYYKPLRQPKDVGIQLLIPREDTTNCPQNSSQ